MLLGRTDQQIIDVYNDLEEADLDACRDFKTHLNPPVPDIEDDFEAAKKGLRPFSDFEWFAVDHEGQIARFTSAGLGAIPQIVFGEVSDYINLRKYLIDLPDISDYNLHIAETESLLADDYITISKKGLYTYDWNTGLGSYEKRPYSLFASPAKPLNVENLEKVFKDALQEICFCEISFQDNVKILVEDFFDEIHF